MTRAWQFQSENDILAVRLGNGRTVGFHARNLEVARLSDEAWNLFSNHPEIQSWQTEVNTRAQTQVLPKTARSITINVTQVCNLQCAYCAAGGDGSYGDPIKRISVEKTIPQLHFFMSRINPGETFNLTFLGGEPLLYPQGIDILAEEAMTMAEQQNLKVKFTLVTNGTLFSSENIKMLKKYGMNITVSLDGPAEVNDLRRPSRNQRPVTATVIAGLQLLFSDRSGLGRIGVSGVFGADNLALDEAYEFYRKLDVDWYDFTYDHHEKRREISTAFTEKILAIAERAFQSGGETALRRIKIFDQYFQTLDSQLRIENHCGAGKSFLMVDARQQIYTCPWVVGDKTEVVGINEQLFEGALDSYQAPLIEKNGCQSCWARHICGGGCMYIHRNQTGSKHQVDVNFCERTRSLIAAAIVYYEQCRMTPAVSSPERTDV